jgi:hypothetical protein
VVPGGDLLGQLGNGGIEVKSAKMSIASLDLDLKVNLP